MKERCSHKLCNEIFFSKLWRGLWNLNSGRSREGVARERPGKISPWFGQPNRFSFSLSFDTGSQFQPLHQGDFFPLVLKSLGISVFLWERFSVMGSTGNSRTILECHNQFLAARSNHLICLRGWMLSQGLASTHFCPSPTVHLCRRLPRLEVNTRCCSSRWLSTLFWHRGSHWDLLFAWLYAGWFGRPGHSLLLPPQALR